MVTGEPANLPYWTKVCGLPTEVPQPSRWGAVAFPPSPVTFTPGSGTDPPPSSAATSNACDTLFSIVQICYVPYQSKDDTNIQNIHLGLSWRAWSLQHPNLQNILRNLLRNLLKTSSRPPLKPPQNLLKTSSKPPLKPPQNLLETFSKPHRNLLQNLFEALPPPLPAQNEALTNFQP